MPYLVIVRTELEAVQGKPNTAQLSFMKFTFPMGCSVFMVLVGDMNNNYSVLDAGLYMYTSGR